MHSHIYVYLSVYLSIYLPVRPALREKQWERVAASRTAPGAGVRGWGLGFLGGAECLVFSV